MLSKRVVSILVGNIQPSESPAVNENRFNNLQEYIDLVNLMIDDLEELSKLVNGHVYPEIKAGTEAYVALKNIYERLGKTYE